ncbi:uncharacterized protein EI90DRAFT_3016812 [Cantharellus anzutake]|uniref:uncharacterized protein n=1 Tax=Cantharellus anzutake TaxID=1750568 RepID=UPI001906CD1A|nr:uncharacterized protein EI90DRAFT_3016812 [Cantharellus anzutake]KAF8330370.1 hypothetical protein EI90DRAFT_3016812 [Cantharellus anzutake]
MALSVLNLPFWEQGAGNVIESTDVAPLVVVEGFLSWTAGSALLWGKFETYLNAHREKLGIHKRRKRRTLDYGEEHARTHKHRRFGRFHPKGLYPDWSSHFPLHFIGQSMGGATITTLITLLRSGFFGRHNYADMVLSVTTLSTPFRGTQLVYHLGENRDSSCEGLFPDLHAESREMTFAETPFNELWEQIQRSSWTESKDTASWDSTFQAAEESSQLFWLNAKKNPSRTWFRSYAASMTERESLDTPFHTPNISKFFPTPALYFSARLIGRFDFSSISPTPAFLFPPSSDPPPPSTRYFTPASTPYLSPLRSSTLILLSDSDEDDDDDELGYTSGPLSSSVPNALSEKYYSNDGIVPLFSQWHPGECSTSRCIHHSTDKSPPPSPPIQMKSLLDEPITASTIHTSHAPTSLRGADTSLGPHFKPGIFHVYHLEGSTNHGSVMPIWFGTEAKTVLARCWRVVGTR